MIFLQPISYFEYFNAWAALTLKIKPGTYWSSDREAFRWFESTGSYHRLLVVRRVWRRKKHGKFDHNDPQLYQPGDYFGILNPQVMQVWDRMSFEQDDETYVPLAVWSDIQDEYLPNGAKFHGLEFGCRGDRGWFLQYSSDAQKFKGFSSVDEVVDSARKQTQEWRAQLLDRKVDRIS